MQCGAFFCCFKAKNAARCIFIALTGGGAMAAKGGFAVGGNANGNEEQRVIMAGNKKGAEPKPSTLIKRLLY